MVQQLKILHCHCSSFCFCCDVGSIPDPGTSACHVRDRKEEKKRKKKRQYYGLTTLTPSTEIPE